MPYQWLRYLHIASAVVFVAVHGASMVVLYSIRGERDRSRVLALLAFSGKTVGPMYAALGATVVTGVLLGLRVSSFRQVWVWLAIGVLVVTSVLMWLVAKPFTERIKLACQMRPSGVPRTSDEELVLILRSSRTHIVAAIGIVGLLLILYLMVFRPLF